MGFQESGLTVSVKDGKVYVSLTDKLLFDTGSIVIDGKGKEALDELAKVLKTQTDINILVEGHTDNARVRNLGQIKDNWDLSVLRATSVVRYLTEVQKLEPIKLEAAGRGEFMPVTSESTPEAKSKNRRIEIIISPKLDELYNLLQKN
ncbi:putative lipoprotein YiaD precursor [compost metagenome]